MRFTVTTGMGDYHHWHAIAKAADEVGFNAFSIPDSSFFPKQSDSIYPYDDTRAVRSYIEATPFIEPMIAFSWLAAVTENLKFYPNVMKVPIRSPILLAKEISSLATISDNRFILGAGIGPWEEDFKYNNVEWKRRGKLLDECLQIIAGLMTGDYFEFHSENFDIGPIKMNPVPSKPVPIIVGGHSSPALRRAARFGDGWVSVKGEKEELKTMVAEINRFRDEFGTRSKPFQFHVGNFDFEAGDSGPRTVDGYRELEDLGFTDYCWLPFVDPSLGEQEKVDVIRRFGDEIISKMG